MVSRTVAIRGSGGAWYTNVSPVAKTAAFGQIVPAKSVNSSQFQVGHPLVSRKLSDG